MNERRTAKVQELIKERVAEVIDREIADPRRGLVTVTRVKVDRDLSTCIIFWTVYGNEAVRSKNAHMLADAGRFVRREIAAVLHTRTVPKVKFIYDEELLEAQRMDDLLRELHDEREQRSDPPTDDPAPEKLD